MRNIFLAAIVLIVLGCNRQTPNNFSDSVRVTIADLQDRRATDSLIYFLRSDQATYRGYAALALASVQDSTAVPALANVLLHDKDRDARINAAFALGQTGTSSAVKALLSTVQEKDSQLLREVLEALGKIATKAEASALMNYVPKDSLAAEGLVWGFYRLGLRNLTDSLMERKVIDFLNSKNSHDTRLAAAHFFARAKITGKGYDSLITQTALCDPSVEVRMAAVGALRKISKEQALPAVQKIISAEKDERVRTNAVRALQAFSLEESSSVLLTALSDSSIRVQVAASEVFKNNTDEKRKDEVARLWIRRVKNWRVRANLLENLYTYQLASTADFEEMKKMYQASVQSYEKAALLQVFSKMQMAYPLVADEMLNSPVSVIQSSAASALVAMNKDKNFDSKNKKAFSDFYQQGVTKGDPAVVAVICSALADSTLNYETVLHSDFTFLSNAKKKLSLPRDFETAQAIDEAIAYLEGKPKPPAPKNSFNHPINWAHVKTIAKDARVAITTSKGKIVMRLLVEEAPGSVANFVDLMNRKYFDGKFVHRVVPNFVIQAGCYRGDGYGSEDYSIRSEFTRRRYKTGSVGMASSGKDTEGTQWFITHSPTPHLDGRYSIFAEVESGMAIVNQIEVGDKIIEVEFVK